MQTTNWFKFSELHGQKRCFYSFFLIQKTMLINPGLFLVIFLWTLHICFWVFVLFCFLPKFKFVLDGAPWKCTFSGWGSIIWYRSINSDGCRKKIYSSMFSVFRTKISFLDALCLLGNVESLVTQNQLYARSIPTTGFCLYIPIARKPQTHEDRIR